MDEAIDLSWLDDAETLAYLLEPDTVPAPSAPVESAQEQNQAGQLLGHWEAREREEPAPIYWSGRFQYKPLPCAERALKAILRRGMEEEIFVPYCLTCQERLLAATWTDVFGQAHVHEVERTVGAASDHARITLNHAVVLVHAESGEVVWMSPYDPMKTQAYTSGRDWTRDLRPDELAGRIDTGWRGDRNPATIPQEVCAL